MHRILLGLLPISLLAQSFSFKPHVVKQGEVLKVIGDNRAQSARINGRAIRLFPQDDGNVLGLMPISALAKPGNYSLKWLDSSGTTLHEESVIVTNAHYATQNIVLSKALSSLKSSPDERHRVGDFLKEVSDERLWHEPFEAPLPGCITSPFGVMRLYNGKPTGDYHAGLDQRGALGSPIRAIAGGTVKIVEKFDLRGGTVAIDHGQGLESIYLHMSQLAAKEGDPVKQGAVIGYVGSSGRSTGPHLHWTLYVNGVPVNPLQWIHLAACPGDVHTRKRSEVTPRAARSSVRPEPRE